LKRKFSLKIKELNQERLMIRVKNPLFLRSNIAVLDWAYLAVFNSPQKMG